MTRKYADEARETADRVASLLEDPDVVRNTVAVHGLDNEGPGGEEGRQWNALNLSSGFPGISLLFSARTPRRPDAALTAHRYLAESVRLMGESERYPGMHNNPCSSAFATWIAHQATGGYVKALRSFDEQISATARWLCDAARAHPLESFATFDVFSGLSGVGRYLLARGDSHRADLEAVLSQLVATSVPGKHQGVDVTGYWSFQPPTVDPDRMRTFGDDGHLNLGLAHGIGGPLALMSLAWRQGVKVPGQREAITHLVDLLRQWSLQDRLGPFWPGWVSYDEWVGGEVIDWRRKRPSWCYGAPGVSRVLQLAGGALAEPEWTQLALESVRSMVASPPQEWVVHDAALCHGWAGSLHLLTHFDQDAEVAETMDEIAASLIAEFDPSLPFGYRFSLEGAIGEADFPGLLDGAAGVALALESYAAGPSSRRPEWAACLLTE